MYAMGEYVCLCLLFVLLTYNNYVSLLTHTFIVIIITMCVMHEYWICVYYAAIECNIVYTYDPDIKLSIRHCN